VHGTDAYFTGVGPKGSDPALERFPDIKKKRWTSDAENMKLGPFCLIL
jgi:hypothetical protein